MRIVDSHMHLGKCRVFELDISKEKLIEYMKTNKIEVAIVQPFPGAPDPVEVHNAIYELSKKNEGKIYGLASVNPHQEERRVLDELERAITKLGFVGIKVHTLGHAVNPMSSDAGLLWQVASKYRVPVMVHTGPGVPFSLPTKVVPRAEEYPEVPIILAHAGFGFFTAESMILAKKYENVYLEISWTPIYDLAWLVKEVPEKILFGSDLPENAPIEIKKIMGLSVSEDVREKIFHENAVRVFGLKG